MRRAGVGSGATLVSSDDFSRNPPESLSSIIERQTGAQPLWKEDTLCGIKTLKRDCVNACRLPRLPCLLNLTFSLGRHFPSSVTSLC